MIFIYNSQVPETLLQTKLYIPPLRPNLVPRPQLIQRLNQGLQLGHKVTLVSAPAGFGKTTLVSEWVAGCGRPAAWLSLDVRDNDPSRFLAYLVAALQTIVAHFGERILGVLQTPQPPPTESLLTALLNEITTISEDFVLVLDDYHVIDAAAVDMATAVDASTDVDEVLTFLLEHTPPQMHLVILTREDPSMPLARLRANNLLTEIRAGDLRFSGRDSDRFLNEVMGLSLSRADITLLESKTEGWIVGLQLAAIAMRLPQSPRSPKSSVSARDRASLSTFINTLSGSHRFILSYLTEQVLNQQPEEIQLFLLQTSILDRLNGSLCDAVTGRSDSRALLERLFRANLFLIPLDDMGQWYRYHHLFAGMLRDLQKAQQGDKTAGLHQRASHWYAQAEGAGLAQSPGLARSPGGEYINQAIQHALAAEDFVMAADLLESHALGMIMQGYAETVNGWVQVIPEEWGLQSPKTNLAFAWMHLLRGAYFRASSYLDRLEGSFSTSQAGEEDRNSLKAEWLAMRSLLLSMQGKMVESLALANQALEIVPQQNGRVRSLVYYGLACAYQAMEYDELVVDAYQKAIHYAREANHLVVEMMSVSSLALMALERGQLNLAFEIAFPVSDRVEQSGSPPPISATVHGILGRVYYQWYQLEQAQDHIFRAIELSVLGGYKTGETFYRAFLARLLQLEGDLEAATWEIQKAVELMQVEAPAYLKEHVISQQARIYLDRNHLAAAEMVLEGQGFSFQDTFSFPDLPSDQNITHTLGLLYNSGLRVLLYRARNERALVSLKPGIELADNLITRALHGQHILVTLETLLLRAQMHAEAGNSRASVADFASAIELAAPEGFISIFVEQGAPVARTLVNLIKQDRLGAIQPGIIKKVQDALSRLLPYTGQTSPSQPAEAELTPLIEPLTERELEVMILMAKGLKYKEIAERLFISLNTVRFHVKAIYSKLNVNTRTKAIEVATQRRLV